MLTTVFKKKITDLNLNCRCKKWCIPYFSYMKHQCQSRLFIVQYALYYTLLICIQSSPPGFIFYHVYNELNAVYHLKLV